MRRGLAIASWAWCAGCAVVSAQMPNNFMLGEEMAISHPFAGYSGTSLEGFTLDGSFTIVAHGSKYNRLDASDHLSILRDGRVVWSVRCESIADPHVVPSVRLVCLYRPADASQPPLTLALASSAKEPLRGAFFSAHKTWYIEGTRRTQIGLVSPDTVGFAISRADDPRPLVFADVVLARLSVKLAVGVSPEDRLELVPLLMSLIQIRDARLAIRDAHEVFEDDPQAVELPPPPELSATPTTHEKHVAELLKMGEVGAARVLWTVISAPEPTANAH